MENDALSTLSVKEKIQEAQEEISRLLFEIDDIKLQVNPQIETDYATKIGYLENELLKWQIEARRKKRALSLAQASKNAGEAVDVSDIEQQLNTEFAKWQEKLQANIQMYMEAVQRRADSKPLSPSDSRELKKLHRILVKRLHPDLHPNRSFEEEMFFAMAQKAYENGDLDLLRSIEVASRNDDAGNDKDLTEAEQEMELEINLAQVRVCEQQLDKLKHSKPYVLKKKLESGKWVMQRTAELNSEIEKQKQVASEYDKRYKALLGATTEAEVLLS